MRYHCAVLGNPIAHSKSPEIQARLADKYDINLQYDKILVPTGNFTSIVQHFFENGGRGLNVTVPCKQLAYELADFSSEYAKQAGAANTLWMQNGKLYADNTDGRGLIHALTKVHGLTLANKRVALIGAGGAARGVVLPLLESGIASLDIFNRTQNKAQTIIDAHVAFSATKMNVLSLNDAASDGYDLLINATSTGLTGNILPLSPSLIHQNTSVYDMVYGHETPFIIWAKENGVPEIRCFDGKSMLEAQAELSFKIWFANEIEMQKND